MIDNYFKRAFARRRMAASHLAIVFDAFVGDLHQRGYAQHTVHSYVQALEHFGRWLERHDVAVRAIKQHHIRRFLYQHLPHCKCPVPAVRTMTACRPALGRLMETLLSHGYLSPPKQRPPGLSATERLLDSFDRYLDGVHGLSVSTRRARRRYAQQFLSWKFRNGRLCLRALKLKDLLLFVKHFPPTWGLGSIRNLSAALRSFLRFLEFTGRITSNLSQAVPRLAYPWPYIVDGHPRR